MYEGTFTRFMGLPKSGMKSGSISKHLLGSGFNAALANTRRYIFLRKVREASVYNHARYELCVSVCDRDHYTHYLESYYRDPGV